MTERAGSAFANDMLALRTRVSELGGLAEDQLSRALDAVRRRDMALARSVVVADAALDSLAFDVEEQSLRTLVIRQPLAQNLRETVSSMRIASTLERVGDLAKNIARRTEALTRLGPQRLERSIGHMGRMVQGQLASSLDSYSAQDIAAAMELWRRDVEIDELYNSLFRDLVMHMSHDPKLVEVGAQMMFIAKNLERIGDHTTFIAEMTYYVAMGEPLGDDRPKGDPIGPIGALDHAPPPFVGARPPSREDGGV